MLWTPAWQRGSLSNTSCALGPPPHLGGVDADGLKQLAPQPVVVVGERLGPVHQPELGLQGRGRRWVSGQVDWTRTGCAGGQRGAAGAAAAPLHNMDTAASSITACRASTSVSHKYWHSMEAPQCSQQRTCRSRWLIFLIIFTASCTEAASKCTSTPSPRTSSGRLHTGQARVAKVRRLDGWHGGSAVVGGMPAHALHMPTHASSVAAAMPGPTPHTCGAAGGDAGPAGRPSGWQCRSPPAAAGR